MTATPADQRPLAGVTVLDFSTLLPGPLATLMLAEAGARVIKIERPGGEDMRIHGPIVGTGAEAMSAYYAVLNRGKEIVTLDLKSADAVDKLRPLIETADVVMEQFRPGVMERLGLGYEALAAINPKIVYCAITGYGATGPRAAAPGHDLNYQATTGALSIGRLPRVDPAPPGLLAADIAGGTFPAVINILLALLGREKTGRGTRLDIAMTDAMFTFGFFPQAEAAVNGRFPDPGEPIFVGSLPRYSLYRTKDERLLAVGSLEEKFWLAFCDVIDLPASLRNDRATPVETRAAVTEKVAARTHAEWAQLLEGTEFCVTPVASLAEALADPHFVARGLFAHSVSTPSGTVLPAAVVPIAPQFRAEPGVVPAPGL
ncbi:CaiB/BaiF CoA transferase family protein [Pinisolibacter sp.]|uniref:CaiB/BaiF CoA transferase family protein n=1 Tax=Pinisolibacter sp. TaxID=2172024 RepID=UPI002FDF03E4